MAMPPPPTCCLCGDAYEKWERSSIQVNRGNSMNTWTVCKACARGADIILSSYCYAINCGRQMLADKDDALWCPWCGELRSGNPRVQPPHCAHPLDFHATCPPDYPTLPAPGSA